MTNLTRSLITGTKSRFERWLNDQFERNRITAHQRGELWDEWHAARAERRSMAAREKRKNNLWDAYRKALNPEIASVRAGIAYYEKKIIFKRDVLETRDTVFLELLAERVQAYKDYLQVLLELAEFLRDRRKSGMTPLETAAFFEQHGKTVPNGGRHWTDWVPPKKREAIRARFAQLPRLADRGRHRVPFPRPVPGLEQHSLGEGDDMD